MNELPNSSKKRNWLKLALRYLPLMIGLLTCGGAILNAFASWYWGGYFKLSLAPEYIPTAEYLVWFPVSTPTSFWIQPPPGSTIKSLQEICVGFDNRELNPNWSQIFLNKQLTSLKDQIVSYTGHLGEFGGWYTIMMCVTPQLEVGFHLLEFWPKPSLFDTYSYTWAYKVE